MATTNVGTAASYTLIAADVGGHAITMCRHGDECDRLDCRAAVQCDYNLMPST